MKTRTAWGLIRDPARRAGAVQPGVALLRVVRQQRWPLNVPLMCAAAGDDVSVPVSDRLVERFGDSIMESREVRTGWLALRGASHGA